MLRPNLLAPETITALSKAGWSPGVDRSGFAKQCEETFFATEAFHLNDHAREILAELGGLRFKQSGHGRTVARRSFWFDPRGAQGESDRFSEFEDCLGVKLCPIGEADDGESFLAAADDGRVLCLMDDGWILGNSIEEALNALVLGEAGEPLYL